MVFPMKKDDLFAWLAERAWLGALVVASIAGVLLIVGSASAAATHRAGVVRTPKTLVAARSSDRHVGHHTPSMKATKPITRAHHRAHRR